VSATALVICAVRAAGVVARVGVSVPTASATITPPAARRLAWM
jgi:hypothetical protein